jgi:hypothetical protein
MSTCVCAFSHCCSHSHSLFSYSLFSHSLFSLSLVSLSLFCFSFRWFTLALFFGVNYDVDDGSAAVINVLLGVMIGGDGGNDMEMLSPPNLAMYPAVSIWLMERSENCRCAKGIDWVALWDVYFLKLEQGCDEQLYNRLFKECNE